MTTPLRYKYQTIDFGETDVHLRMLRDRQQFHDHLGQAEAMGVSTASWPLFGVLWDSGQVLSRIMVNYEVAGKRILEVGCGIALASHVLNQRGANITATDYNPEAGIFLLHNSQLNNENNIPFVRTGWQEDAPKLGDFDLLIGSDILYEPNHVEILSHFINSHAMPQCEIILVDPGRGYINKFRRQMLSLGYAQEPLTLPDMATVQLSTSFRGKAVRFQR